MVVSFGVRQNSVDAFDPHHPEKFVQVGRNEIGWHFNESDLPIVIDCQQISRLYSFKEIELEGQLAAGIEFKPDFRLPQPRSQFLNGGHDCGQIVSWKGMRKMGGAYDPRDTVNGCNLRHLETPAPVFSTIVQTRKYMAMNIDHFYAFWIDPRIDAGSNLMGYSACRGTCKPISLARRLFTLF